MPLLEAIKESSSVIILVATTVIFFSALGTVLSTVIYINFLGRHRHNKNRCPINFRNDFRCPICDRPFCDYPIFPFIIAAILSLNGLSIHMQVAVIAKSANIPMLPYIGGRLWSIVLVPFFIS